MENTILLSFVGEIILCTPKAFLVSANNRSVIVFAQNYAQAKRKARPSIVATYASIEKCRRIPWADHYKTVDTVPAQDRINHGIFSMCPWCGNLINNVTPKMILSGPDAFCDRACKGSYTIRRNAIDKATARWFGIEILSTDGIGNAREVVFQFPGCHTYVVWHSGKEMLSLDAADRAPWRRWEKFCRRKKKEATTPPLVTASH